MSEETRTVLAGNAAVNLWLKGKDAWNKWVKENPEADVDFSNVDFTPICRAHELTRICFSNFNFPIGNVNFNRTTFSEILVDFRGVTFGEGNISFGNATFSNGDVYFRNATFNAGNVYFRDAIFNAGDVDFDGATFGEGFIDFRAATFGQGYIYFKNTTFGEGNVDFSNTTFGEGEVDFTGATFDKGYVSFHSAKANGDAFRLERLRSKAVLDLSRIKQIENWTTLSLRHSSFEDSVILPPGRYNCVPDLRNSRIAKAITFHDIKPTLKRRLNSDWNIWEWKAEDPEDTSRLRRLKELAEANKDHQSALAFHADELRSERWHTTRFWQSVLDATFSLLSDYGQSIIRPLIALLVMDLGLIGFYAGNAEGKWRAAYEYVTANSLPFLSNSRAVRDTALEALYTDAIPNFVTTLTFAQGIGSVIFLFLIGLGLRNRFRI